MNSETLEKFKSYLTKMGFTESGMTKGYFEIRDGSHIVADLRGDKPIVGVMINGMIHTTGHGLARVGDIQMGVEQVMKEAERQQKKLQSLSTEHSEKQPPQKSLAGTLPDANASHAETTEMDKSKLGIPDTKAEKKGKTTAKCAGCNKSFDTTVDDAAQIVEKHGNLYCQDCREKLHPAQEPKQPEKPEVKIPKCRKCGIEVPANRALELFQNEKELLCEDCEEKKEQPRKQEHIEPEMTKDYKGDLNWEKPIKEEIKVNEDVKESKENLPAVNYKALNVDIIKKYICPTTTESEAYNFLQLCLHRDLNPFLKEAYLIKYGNQPATMVVGKDAFTRKAEESGKLDGYEAGIIVMNKDKLIERRIGVVQFEGDILVGGWAKVFRKDMKYPFVCEVPLSEYLKRKQDGTPQSSWGIMPGTMIRKVALVQSLREAFTKELGGCYDASELLDKELK